MIGVIGIRTTIIAELCQLRGIEPLTGCTRLTPGAAAGCAEYVLAGGVIHAKRASEHSYEEIEECVRVNTSDPILTCEAILTTEPRARIVVIGSESAYLGSYDELYAAGKRELHRYVAMRPTRAGQLLSLVSPPIISDAGMTLRRHDYPAVLEQRRTVTSRQVAELVNSLLIVGPHRFENRQVVRM